MYNNISDYKKLVFLLVILGQVWKKSIPTSKITGVLKKLNSKVKVKID
jgi:hypothetical protein